MSEVEGSGEFGSPGWWSRVWRDPDPAMLDAGSTGEKVVAWVRIVATLLLLTVPVGSLMAHPELSENWIGVTVTLIALLLAIVVFFAVRRDQRPRWLGAACTVFDVSIISAALLSYVLTDQPLVATNSRVAFECYFLAMAATCLRYDARLCILAGGLAIAEYLGLVFLAVNMYDLNSLTDGIQPLRRIRLGQRLVPGHGARYRVVLQHRHRDARQGPAEAVVDRPDDRALQPGSLRRAPGCRAQPRAADAAAAVGGHARRGPVQGIQRPLRSFGGRRRASGPSPTGSGR